MNTSNIDASSPLGKVIPHTEFRFDRLAIAGIDNEPVFVNNGPEQREEETILLHNSVASGDAYVELLAQRIEDAIRNRRGLPVIRFADGEYAFYDGSMKCNGLYQQAESVQAIRSAIPGHIEDIRYVMQQGVAAPLVFPGNVRRVSRISRLFKKRKGNEMGLRFLELLAKHQLRLAAKSYIPFYAVYAYLSSPRFAQALDGKTVCVVNSDYNAEACAAWFASAGSRPKIVHVPISHSYVATQWPAMREGVFGHIKEPADCFMVGAGIGALQVCADLSRRYNAPAIDSGHILNVMNSLESKSAGPRLYTHRR